MRPFGYIHLDTLEIREEAIAPSAEGSLLLSSVFVSFARATKAVSGRSVRRSSMLSKDSRGPGTFPWPTPDGTLLGELSKSRWR